MQAGIFTLVTAQDVEMELCLNVTRPFGCVFILRCLRLCLPCTCAAEVSAVCNSAPWMSDVLLAPTVVLRSHPPAPRGAVVRLTWRSDGSVCTFPSLPRVILPGNATAHTPHTSFVLVRIVLVCIISTTRACFVFFLICFWHNVYSHLSASSAMAAGVSILSDLPYSTSGAHSGDNGTEMETGRRALQHTDTHEESCWVVFYTLS